MNAIAGMLTPVLAGAVLCAAGPLSLGDAQSALFLKNPDIAAAEAEQAKNRYAFDEGKALWHPTLDVVGNYTYFTKKNSITTTGLSIDSLNKLLNGLSSGTPSFPRSMTQEMTTEIGSNNRAEIGADIGFPLTQALVNINNVRRLNQAIHTKDAQNAALRNQLSFKLGLTFLAWQFSYEKTAVQNALIDQLSKYADQLANLKAGGLASAARVLEARSHLEMARVDLLSATSLSDSLKLEVMSLTGISDPSIEPRTFDFGLDSAAWHSLDTVTANTNRPEIAALDSAIAQAATLDLVTSGQKYPNLILFAGYRLANPGLNMGSDDFMNYGMAGATLKWNLWDGLRVHNQRLQVRQQAEVLKRNRESVVATMDRGRGQCLLQVRKAMAQEPAAQAALQAAEALAADLKNSLDAGVVTSADYLNALTQLSLARLSVKQAAFAKATAYLQLLYATGKELKY